MDIRHFDWNGTESRHRSLRDSITSGPEDEGPNERRGNLSHDLTTNHPPVEQPAHAPLIFAKTALGMLEQFLDDTPVIETAEDASKAKVHIETARGALAEMEAERDGKVRPLNERVADINSTYGEVSRPFKRVLDDVKARLTAWAKAEEKKREKIAEEKRLAAQKLLDEAREKERVENEARENAAAGELDVGLAAKVVATDDAIKDFKVANRQAAIAERDSTVRIGGGAPGRKALGMRTVTTLTLVDALKALAVMGVSEKTRESILSDARAYKKLNGQWPSGVTAEESREI